MDWWSVQLCGSKKPIYQSLSDKNEHVDAVIVDQLKSNKECCQKDKSKAQNEKEEIFEKRKEITLNISTTKNYKPLFSIMLGRCVLNKQLLGATYDNEIENIIADFV